MISCLIIVVGICSGALFQSEKYEACSRCYYSNKPSDTMDILMKISFIMNLSLISEIYTNYLPIESNSTSPLREKKDYYGKVD